MTCVAIILKEEGGNDDDPRDHGGRTSRGITQKEWDAWRKAKPDLPADVWKAPDGEIRSIYHDQYWDPYCDKLPDGIDLCFFNRSVNSGRTQAVKELQRALGVKVDGMMGMLTLDAANSADRIAVISKMSDLAVQFYHANRQFNIYGKGWLARTKRVKIAALRMAAGASPTSVIVSHPNVNTLPDDPAVTVSAKAEPTNVARPPVSQETGVATTTASAAAGGVVDQVQNAASQLSPFADTLQIVKYILIAVAVVSFGLTIYAIWHNHSTKEAVG